MSEWTVKSVSWARRRLLLLVVAVMLGMAVGASAYYASRLNGVALFSITGGVTALAVVLVWEWFSKSAAVSEVEVSLPQFSRVTFTVSKDHRVLSKRIFFQLVSRISVQEIGSGSGRADEAIASLHNLFVFVRDLLDEYASASSNSRRPKVDVLAMNMINVHLRPFLSRWHRTYQDWRDLNPDLLESQWPDDEMFRDELRILQAQLRPIAVGFAEMAGYGDHKDLIGLQKESDED